MVNRERMVNEFLELVKIDSVSGFERKIADTLKLKLEELGMVVYEDDAGSKINTQAGNLIARLPATGGSGAPLLLCAHMDTVEPGRGVKPVLEGDLIKSSGDTVLGADDKAGIAIIFEAVRVIKENQVKHGGLEVVLTVFEEGGLLGAANIDREKIESKIGFILDSDGPPGSIVTQAPTQDRISITVKGKSAHAGICPEKGISAIEVAAKAIAGMKLGRIDGETTANIGVISGGKATNIVPDTVFIQGETRSLDGARVKKQTGEIIDKAREAAEQFGAQLDIKVENLYREFNIDKDERVVKIAAEAARSISLEPRLLSTGGGSDANMFNEKGISTVVLGIAMQNVHTTGEYIKIDDLVMGSKYIVEIVKSAQKY
ncbi:MAG: peptidase M20 [Peptococcaceae bacterium BICA1-7]|nr:MAG: peptidase M20 [Peptococcaceae bacterium BICA1-7]HBV96869.1 peptidase M20 [Desulfotomaculum sp.]